jgi:hypothetical protein
MSGIVAANKGLQQTDMLAKKAQASTTGLGSAVGSLKNILGTVGVGFGMFQVVSMMQKGIEKAHELHQAEAQINAGLISTGYAAGMTADAIAGIAKQLSGASLYGRAELLNMQSLLVTFPSITSKTFGSASQAIVDMSTKMNRSLSDTAIQVGKALQDPILGITALRRVGVNFNNEQKEVLKNLVENGKKAEAQQIILKELNVEFGGSAKAAFDVTPLARYNKIVGKIQLALGEMVLKIQGRLSPALEFMATKMKSVVQVGIEVGKWMIENKGVVLALVGGFVLYHGILSAVALKTAIMTWYTGLSTAAIIVNTLVTEGWAAAMIAVNMAMAANPIGFIIAGVALLVAGIIYAYNKFGWFRGAIYGTWEALKGFGIMLKDYVIDRIKGVLTGLGGLAKAIGQVFSGDFKAAWETAKVAGADLVGITAGKKAIDNARAVGKNIGAAYHQGVADVAQSKTGAKNGAKAGIATATLPGLGDVGGAGTGGGTGTKPATEKVAAGGTRNTSITINLGKMVENIVFQGGVKENERDLVRQVEEILLRTLYAAQSAS